MFFGSAFQTQNCVSYTDLSIYNLYFDPDCLCFGNHCCFNGSVSCCYIGQWVVVKMWKLVGPFILVYQLVLYIEHVAFARWQQRSRWRF